MAAVWLRVEDNLSILKTARRSCPPSRTGSCRHEEVASQRFAAAFRRSADHFDRVAARYESLRGADDPGVWIGSTRQSWSPPGCGPASGDRHRLRDRADAAALAVSTEPGLSASVVAGDARRGARERPRRHRGR